MLCSKKMRWKSSLVCLSAVLLGGLAGCGSSGKDETVEGAMSVDELLSASWEEIEAQAKAEGSVTYFTFSDEDVYTKVMQGFEDKYGIETNLVVADGNSGIDKALAEKDGEVGSFDVMKLGGERVAMAMSADLVAGPIIDMLPYKDKLDPSLSVMQEGVEHHGYLVPVQGNQSGLLYNTETVTDPPKTWEELEAWIDANPKRFGMCTPDKGGSGQAFVQTVIGQTTGGLDQYYGDTEVDTAKTEKWSAAWDWFNERKDKIVFTASNNDSIARLNQGEFDIVAAWDDNAFRVMKNGELFTHADLYVPEFGMPGGGDTNGLLKNAPHPAAGLLLINYMSSEEGQQILMDNLKCASARTDMENENSFLTQDDLDHAAAWIPAVYKGQFISDFTQYVMMAG